MLKSKVQDKLLEGLGQIWGARDGYLQVAPPAGASARLLHVSCSWVWVQNATQSCWFFNELYNTGVCTPKGSSIMITEYAAMEGTHKHCRVHLQALHTAAPRVPPCALEHFQTLLELCQVWYRDHFPGDPAPVPNEPLGEEPIPHTKVQTGFFITALAITSCRLSCITTQ